MGVGVAVEALRGGRFASVIPDADTKPDMPKPITPPISTPMTAIHVTMPTAFCLKCGPWMCGSRCGGSAGTAGMVAVVDAAARTGAAGGIGADRFSTDF